MALQLLPRNLISPPRELPYLSPSRTARIVLYSHDTQGLGHLRRNLLIASALLGMAPRPTILLVCGAREVGAFNVPKGVDCLTVPSLSKSSDGDYGVRHLDVSMPELVAMRRRTMLAGIRAFDPDMLIADKVPLGAQRELEPTLQWLRRRGRSVNVLGLREVLDETSVVAREWTRDDCDRAIAKYYDAVWVYGDPGVFDPVREYRLHAAIASKVRYTGYLNPLDVRDPETKREQPVGLALGEQTDGRAEQDSQHEPMMLCSVGGGQDGAELALAFAGTDLPEGTRGVLLTGPFMPPDVRERLRACAARRPCLSVREFVTEPFLLMHRASRIICMGGYNSVCEALAFGHPTLVVPRVRPRLEQWIRATRLSERGLIDVLHPDGLSPEALASWMRSPARATRRTDDDHRPVRFDGLQQLPVLGAELLSAECSRRLARVKSKEPAHARL